MLILNLLMCMTFSAVISIQFSTVGPKNSDTYGPYVVQWKYFGVCPRSGNTLANLSTSLTFDENTSTYRGIVNFTLPETVRIDEMKVVIQNIKNDRKRLIWDYTIEKPCQQRILMTTLKSYMHLRSCILKKGAYNCKINFSEAVKMFFGSSFFYGEYIITVSLGSRKQSIGCVLFRELINKIP